MKKREVKKIRKNTHRVLYMVLFLALVSLLVVSVVNSLFVNHPDRINVVFYGEKTAFYSFGKTDNINYFTYMYPDFKMLIPGGYGYYRVGALGKLISLEKKPDLFIRGFSTVNSTFVNFYFYPPSDKIYYGDKNSSSVFFPSLSQIWFRASNTNLLDRVYIWLLFATAKKSDFANLAADVVKNQQQKKLVDESGLPKRYQGFFYQKTYRDEMKSVQIIYTKQYNSAVIISQILEGSGIRVVDISQGNKQPKVCVVSEEGSSLSQTAKDLAKFFHCDLIKAKTRVSDIILDLGNQEAAWSGE